ncbi:MAG: nucleoside hydrolase [Terrimesophilobacter sp.]
MALKLILDCDTGTDDAVAIMAAAQHPRLDLIAVTTVNGNVPLANVTENTLRVLDLLNSKVPVHVGASRPIVRPDFPIPRHILNGKGSVHPDYLDLPPAVSSPQPASAVSFLIDHYLSDVGPETVLVATGPLTNVALALAAEPRLAECIPRLVVMGGARGWGNVTPAAEFNIWVDPEAAESVFSSGIRDIMIVPLDATHSAPISLADCDRFDDIGSPAALASSAFIRHRIENYRDAPGAQRTDAPVHDALCVAYLVHPDILIDVKEWSVHVETRGEFTLGQTVFDSREWSSERRNARVALRADAQTFVQFLSDAFAG